MPALISSKISMIPFLSVCHNDLCESSCMCRYLSPFSGSQDRGFAISDPNPPAQHINITGAFLPEERSSNSEASVSEEQLEFREEPAADPLRTSPSDVSRVVLGEAWATKLEFPATQIASGSNAAAVPCGAAVLLLRSFVERH